MKTGVVVKYRKATKYDLYFLSSILADAAAASGVCISVEDLPNHSDTYQYVEGFPRGNDVGVVAETDEGFLVGAAWIRLLPTDIHAIGEHLPELTLGVIPQYQRIGIGKCLMEALYKAVRAQGISKISLGVHQDNIQAIHLYRQDQWVEDGRYLEYIMMSKVLL